MTQISTTIEITVIHCWSAPRSRSTALLYSFEARGMDDCVAIDEPLYRAWLLKRQRQRLKTRNHENDDDSNNGSGVTLTRPYTEALIHGCPPSSPPPLSLLPMQQHKNNNNDNNCVWKRELFSLPERLEQAARHLLNAKKRARNTNSVSSSSSSSHNSTSNRNIHYGGVIFCKHMAKHYTHYDFEHQFQFQSTTISQSQSCTPSSGAGNDEEDHDDIDRLLHINHVQLVHKHVLLLRDPVAVVRSWSRVVDNLTTLGHYDHGNNAPSITSTTTTSIDEVGIVPLLSIYSILSSLQTSSFSASSSSSHNNPSNVVVVLDSDALMQSNDKARQTLQTLCTEDLNIPFRESMMEWPSGPHACDGPWAPWWYQDVHVSTGWNNKNNNNNNNTATMTAATTTASHTTAMSSAPPSIIPNANSNSNSNSTLSRKRKKTYRTVSPAWMPALSASDPAYTFLYRLTRTYLQRGPPPAQLYAEDPRNEHLLVFIGSARYSASGDCGCAGGRLVPRAYAGVSPWDSVVQGGDACWEGLRIYRGKILSLDAHIQRLFKSARALGFNVNLDMDSSNHHNTNAQNAPKIIIMHTREQVIDAIFETLAANNMRDNVHIRVTLTRGEKCTSSMNPVFNVYGTTLIVLAEWKPLVGRTTYDNERGIRLISASGRRNGPHTVDSKIHHNNLINNILPKIQANLAGCADALMLDTDGFVSETNATNIFMVESDVLLTPPPDTCLPGITRETVLTLAREAGIPVEIRRLSLAEFHAADEVFTTGTMGGITPVTMIDGRSIGGPQPHDGSDKRGPITKRLQELYASIIDRPGWSTPIPPFDNENHE